MESDGEREGERNRGGQSEGKGGQVGWGEDPVSLVGMSYWFIQSQFVEQPQIKYTHACKSVREGGRDGETERQKE